MKPERLICASLTIALVALFTATASAAETAPTATLTVSGAGTVTPAPDRAVVSFDLQTVGSDSAKATSANAAIANVLTAKMVQLGFPGSAVTTSGYGLTYQPRPSRPDPANDQRYGYTVSRTMNVTVDNIERAGAVVDAGVAAGATNVNGVNFMLRDPLAAERAAQAAALTDAVAQARALAAGAGVRLVRILSIGPGAETGVRPLPVMRMALTAAPTPTTIAPGNLNVEANVTLRYEIVPAR